MVTRVLAVDVGGTTTKVKVTSADGVVVASARRGTPRWDRAREAVSYDGPVEVEIFNAGVWAADPGAVLATAITRYRQLIEPYATTSTTSEGAL